MISLRVNAQEVPIDIQEPVAIENTLEAQPEQIVIDTPVVDAPTTGVVVDDSIARDSKRLDIMAFQSLSFESTGEYTQVIDAKVVDGDVIGFEASMVGVVEPTEEIHVYEAPCGKGWQLLIYEDNIIRELSSSTKMFEDRVERTVRSYGYGCEHDSRTVNW